MSSRLCLPTCDQTIFDLLGKKLLDFSGHMCMAMTLEIASVLLYGNTYMHDEQITYKVQ